MVGRIHDWIFGIVEEVCWDREYLYLCFCEHFNEIMREIHRVGRISSCGEHVIPGMKGQLEAVLRWTLVRRVEFRGSNIVTISYEIRDRASGVVENEQKADFELSSGERIAVGKESV